ncbi:tricorn protease [Psychromicrobium silvestre]|uniref:Tricorn protease homolog n=1 Tax=Psychromicrobium silvestre TaxID=1645614 RepID=A0A7Y9LR18_9MICC|nr:S41 family peptidase [Psychromicrobium silvestre]NYE94013.1 tricorn protease [Psychromicrobium silvestre]
MGLENSHYLRYPHLHGELLTFVAEDDVWLAPLSGGRAWRISSLGLPAKNPRFSPDGSRLAWTVTQGTAPEVVSASVDGGDVERLTWFGHLSTKLRGFNPDGTALVVSAFEQPESRHTFGYAVSLVDGSRTSLPYGPVDSVVYGPAVGDEKPVLVSSVYSREPAWWKRYRGGTSGKLWLDRDGSGDFSRLVPELDGNLVDPMWIGDRIAFLSDHEGYGNLYSVDSSGKSLRRHTDHEGFYVRHASTDGQRVVFESAGNLFLVDGLDAQPVRLEISLGSASTGRRPRPLNVAQQLGEVRPDHEGRASIVESHGTVHLLTHRDGPARKIESVPGVRARLARPLGDDRVVYLADHDGVEAIYLAPLAPAGSTGSTEPENTPPAAPVSPVEEGSAEELPSPVSAASVNSSASKAVEPPAEASSAPASSESAGSGQTAAKSQKLGSEVRKIDFPGPGRAAAVEASPDGKYVAIGTEYGQVLLLNVDSGTLQELAETKIGRVSELVFSPDSRWLLWSEPTSADSERARLRLSKIGGEEILEVTDGRFSDFSPSFSPDGKFIAFLSRRSFDPVYDTHNFDLAFPQAVKPYLIALAAETPSPFGPSIAGSNAGTEQKAKEKDEDKKDDAAGESTVVDPAGLADRVVSIPAAQGGYEVLRAVSGGVLWLRRELEGVTGDGRGSSSDQEKSPQLELFDFTSKETTVLVEAADSFELSGDGNRIVVIDKNKVRVLPSDKKVEEKSRENIQLDLSRIRVVLQPVKVWGQAFDEAWRLQRDFFWTEDMAGLDWQGVYDNYRPIVERLGSHDDLVDLLWEMHGELGTSHAYVTPKAIQEPGTGPQGRLGAEIVKTAVGWEVQGILPGESSDPLARSPLTAPGAAVKVGDVLLAIDGVEVAQAGPEPLLAGAADKIVELTLRNGSAHGDKAGQERRIAVVPIRDEERLRYQDWVRRNRELVRETSENRFGYLHVPDMQARGWSQLHRDLEQEFSKDALIVDVRRNRGGHTSQLVAELIGRKITAWTRSRAIQDMTYPSHAPHGPVVILTDEFAGSDGDIITQVSKLRGIGPVVGVRTWGGVVGIDGRFGLADGTAVTQPRYAFWFTGGIGWGVENYGVDPDIEVTFPPHAYGAGEDPQLEYGLGVLREMLNEIPTEQAPAHEGYRTLRPGSLPPRPQG